MTNETQMLLGLFLGIAVMMFLVMKTKTHTFIALLLAALVTGIAGHVSPSRATDTTRNGSGSTLKSADTIIGLGVMMGGTLEKTGTAEYLVYTLIHLIGEGKEEWALGITGWLVSIPVLADSTIVISAPLCKATSRVTGKSVTGLALVLIRGLQHTHVMVPPAPGPLIAAGVVGIGVGQMILAGSSMSTLISVAAILHAKWVGRNTYQVPHKGSIFERMGYEKEYLKIMGQLEEAVNTREFSGLAPSFTPILTPPVLILSKIIVDFVGMPEGTAHTIISLLGSSIVALGTGTTLAIYGLDAKIDKEKFPGIMNDSIKDTGMIMLITGVGGSLGNVIKVSGIGDMLGATVVSRSISTILTPLIIGAFMCLALGSVTATITTVTSLTTPLVSVLEVNPILLVQSCHIGAAIFSYFNDSRLWVFNGMSSPTDLKDQLKYRTAVSMIMTGVGTAELLVFNMVM